MTNIVKSSLALLALSAAAVFPVQAQTFSKTFDSSLSPQCGAAPVSACFALNHTTVMTFTITAPVAGMGAYGFNDQLDASLDYVPTAIVDPACNGTVNVTSGPETIHFTGTSLASNAVCTVQVGVKGVADSLGFKINAATGTGALNTNAAALFTVQSPTFSKVFAGVPFGPSSIPSIKINGTTALTFTITNTTVNSISVGFSDTLPNGFTAVSAFPTTACLGLGTVKKIAGVGGLPDTVTLENLPLVPGDSCSFSVQVAGSVATSTTQPHDNTADGTQDLFPLTATAKIFVLRPQFDKSFDNLILPLNSTTDMVFTVTNNTGLTLNNLGFTDNPIPAGLQALSVSAVPNSNTCGFTLTALPAASLTATTGHVNPNSTCLLRITVRGVAKGLASNFAQGTGDIDGLPGVGVTTVVGPTLTKTFAKPAIPIGTSTTMTITVNNTTAFPFNNLKFTDNVSANLTVGTVVSNSCAAAPAVGSSPGQAISVVGGSVAANSSCALVVNVTGNTVNPSISNTVNGFDDLINLTDTTTIGVTPPPGLTKQFIPNSIDTGTFSTLRFVVSNNTAITLSNLGFGDTLPAGVTFDSLISNLCTPPNGPVGSTGSLLTGATITLAGATLAPGGSCIIDIKVKGTAAVKTTVTNHATGSGDLININPQADLTITIPAPPGTILFSKAFSAASVPVNTNVDLTFTFTNKSGASTSLLGFTDNLALLDMIIVAGAPPNPNTCGGFVSAPINGTVISLTNGVLPDTLSCSLTITVKALTAGPKHNVAVGKDVLNGQQATADVLVTQSVFSKVFSTNSTTVGSVVKLTFTIPNNTGAPIAVGFTDNLLPLGLAVAAPLNFSVIGCGGGASFAPTVGATLLSLTTATVAANSVCTVTVDLVNTSPGSKHNVALGTGDILGQTATADLDVFDPPSDAFQVRYFSNLNVGESFINLTNYGGASTVSLPIQNGNLCVSAFTYSPDEQLISCCSCQVTPNGLNSLQVRADLASNTLTPIIPSSVVVKLLATQSNGTCNPAIVTRADLRAGLAAWGSTLHATPVTPGTPAGTYGMTETPFSRATLSDAELTRMIQLCSFIKANGSGFGICKSCQIGGLGASAR